MSKIALTPNASGSGTFTIAAPNSNTDRTLTLPDSAGELLTTTGDGSNLTGITSYSPIIFSASTTSDFTLTHNSETKMPFDSERVDTDGCYDPTTNYRFTPTTAGYYQLSCVIPFSGHAGINWSGNAKIYKNGSAIARSTGGETSGWGTNSMSFNVIAEANGTTDYFEVYVYQYNYTNAGSMNIASFSGLGCLFEGHFLRALV